jgi:endonuclease YncB( thermonuclease family)
MQLPRWAARIPLAGSGLCLVAFGLGAGSLVELRHSDIDEMTPVVVTRALDATTVEARLEAGTTEQVRLLGIAAVACYEGPARIRLNSLVKSRTALLELPDLPRDRSGRLYGYLWLSGRLVNEQLVAEGAAVPLEIESRGDYADQIENAADSARDASLGLWSKCGPSDDADNTEPAARFNEDEQETDPPLSTNPSGPRRVVPISTWECTPTHPVKAAVSNGVLVYTRPDQRHGPRLKPSACFASEADAQRAGYRYVGD